MNELERLRRDLDSERELNRKLWVAVAYLQQAIGAACGYVESGGVPDDTNNLFDPTNKAADILDGIISLTPADKA